MFDDLIREMRRLHNSKISIPIEADEDGYYDKQCPDENCLYDFKVNANDWGTLFKYESVFCPLCRNEAPAEDFFSKEQIEQAKTQAVEYANMKINRALRSSARKFNNSQNKKSLITMNMKISGSNVVYKPIVPVLAKEILIQKLSCENCGANYAVLGSAFFCPCCGFNSIDHSYASTISKIESKINNLDVIRRAISDQDQAEDTCRSLIESALCDCVVCFQFFCERSYEVNPNITKQAPFNAFQKIDVGMKLWFDLFGETYSDWLSSIELSEMQVFFQKRHLLAHKEGIVDQAYINKSGDTNYQVGQRIVVRKSDVESLLNVVQKITSKIAELS